MKLPTFNKLRKEDFSDAPDWMNRVFYVLNLFIEQVYNILNKNITFNDNIQGQIRKIQITSNDLPYKFKADRPSCVIVGNCTMVTSSFTEINKAVFVEWYYDVDSIVLHNVVGIDTNKYNITLLII